MRAHAGDAPHRIVCLGDYVDRGPDSAGVVETLRELQARSPGRVICLKGNHEDLLLRAASDEREEPLWRMNGGDATLASFGVRRARDLPADVLAWFADLPTFLDDGSRLFVHAGLNPSRALADQVDEDRLWIRRPFLDADHDFARFVVHGHTPQRSGRPDLARRRLNLDTAAVYGGRLSAAAFAADDPRPTEFLSVPA